MIKKMKNKKEKHLAVWQLSGLIGTFVMFFRATGQGVHHENT